MVGFAASVSLLVRHWKAILAWQAAQEPEQEDLGQPLLLQVRSPTALWAPPAASRYTWYLWSKH